MRKLPLILLSSALLSSCGYTPLYAPVNGDIAGHKVEIGTVEASNVKLLPGERLAAQRVAQQLRRDYPDSAAELDVLEVHITEQSATLAVEKTATISRAQIILNANATLTSPQGNVLVKITVSASSAYNVEDSPYSTESGKSYARLVAADNLATEISRRVALYYAHPTQAPTPQELKAPKAKHHNKI